MSFRYFVLLYITKSMQKLTSSTALCSDELEHDKCSIFFYNSFKVNDLKAKVLHFDFVHYRSNGPSSQFENQYNFTNLKFHEKGHVMMAEWNFFTTSHSKGENDGVGGNVKNGIGGCYFSKKRW